MEAPDRIHLPVTAPNQIYLEQWPEEADREDRIFFEPTGYGLDGKGNASTITVYVKESLAGNPTPQTARVAFKSWSLDEQRAFLAGLESEHAYAAGAAGMPFPIELVGGPIALRAEWAHGREHYTEWKAQVDAGERGEIPLTDSDGKVTWDFVENDVGFDDEQLAARKAARDRLCAAPVVEIAAMEGESSGSDGEPYWYAIYLRDRAADEALGLSVGTIQCASGRPTEQAILAALTRWRPSVQYKVTKTVFNHGGSLIVAG